MNEDDKYEDLDDELLEDFEKELEIENKAHKKKRILIGVGAVVGLALALYLSGGGTPAAVDTAANVPAPAAPKPAAPSPKAPEPVAQVPAEPEVKPVETVRESEENLEQQIAALQEHNMINEDFQAPGALMDEGPAQDTGAQAPEPKDERAAETAEDDTPKEKELTPAQTAPQAQSAPAEPAEKETVTAMVKAPKAPAPAPASKPEAAQKAESDPYSVEVHAGLDAVAALALRDRLVDKGFDAWISIGKVKKTVYRVEAGKFKSIRQASGLSAKMAESGFETRAAYVDNGKVATLIAGTFQDRSAAENLQSRIRSAGFSPEVRQKSDSISLYHVRVGRFKSRDEASGAMQSVKAAGFPARGVIR